MEYVLIEFLVNSNNWISGNPIPSPPSNYQQQGDIEYGIILFFLNNPKSNIILNLDALEVVQDFIDLLKACSISLPATSITIDQYDLLNDNKTVYYDGSMIGTNQYELYDQCWITALGNLILTCENLNFYSLTIPTPTNSVLIPTTSQTSSNQITFGLLSDWGTGLPSAKAVMT